MRLPWIIGVALTCACVAAGCASGDDSSSATSAATTSPATTARAAGATTTSSGASNGAKTAAWTTYYGNAARTGLATDGPAPAGVKKQWTAQVDGDVYAQPLIVGNRVVIATEDNTVYLLNAANGAVVWRRHLAEPVPNSSLPCGNVDPVGITGTPVYDTARQRIYAAGMVRPHQHMLWALDAHNGRVIASTVVDAPGSDPTAQNQRSALTLANGQVYVPFGGRFGDCGTYHGRVVAVAATAAGLGAVTSYTLPTEGRGGWWTPPGAATASDGSLYFATGNSSSSSRFDYGNSVVRVHGVPPRLSDYWAPTDWRPLNQSDGDIGTTSPVLLPHDRVFQVGKPGNGYLLNAAKLGGIGGELHKGDVCNGFAAFGGVAHDGDTLFVPCGNAVVQVTVNGDTFSTGWRASLSTPGPTVVANGAVWAIATGNSDLVALDRTNGRTITTQSIGNVPSRFVSPAVAGGRVIAVGNRTVYAFGD